MKRGRRHPGGRAAFPGLTLGGDQAPDLLEVGGGLQGAQVVRVDGIEGGELADGRPIEFDAVDVFDMRDGKLWKMSSWFDIDHIRRQSS